MSFNIDSLLEYDDNTHKVCRKCFIKKLRNEFSKDNHYKDGLNYYCKNCRGIERKIYRQGNKYKARKRFYSIKQRYGINELQYNKILSRQNNCCGICGKEFEKTPHVDHCHRTNKIRGLLCGACNAKLAWLENRKQLIINWIDK